MLGDLFMIVRDQGEAYYSISLEDTDKFQEDRLINYCNHFILEITDVTMQDIYIVYKIEVNNNV